MNYCCKWPNYDFYISRGSVATVLRWVGKITVIYAKFLLDVACQKLLKSANVSRSYSKNESGFLFFEHGVVSYGHVSAPSEVLTGP